MPQLDKLIFFMENLGFVMSFFFLVFYNQYVFYPKLLKNIFVRKFFILKLNLNILFLNLLKFSGSNIFFKFIKLNQLYDFFFNYYNEFFKKIHFYLNLKLKLLKYFILLLVFKFKFLFSSFYEIYRAYIVELNFKI